MLTTLSLGNFKSWASTDLMGLAPITGLFGTNSSGKSSILQFLMLLKQTKESTDRNLALDFGGSSSYVELGGFPDVIHGHDTKKELSWMLNWRADGEIMERLAESLRLSGRENDFWLDATVSANPGPEPVCRHLAYSMEDTTLVMEWTGTGKRYRLTDGGFGLKRLRGGPQTLPGPVKSYAFPDEVRTYHQNAEFLADLELAYERQMDQIYYLGPLREFPRREYLWSGGKPTDVGRRGEKAVDAILAAGLSGGSISRGRGKRRATLEAHIASWLQKLDLIHSFRVEEVAKGARIYRVKVKRTPRSAETLITDVGFGVSQILPVLEQPEIHLHPSVQTGLADVFIDAAQSRGIQIIFESHSEHLLLRLQRRLAEKQVTGDQIALYFCEQDNGKSKLTTLQIDEYGNITNWPKNFFGDQFGEIAAREKAALRRRMSSQ
jgi:predicted ATPase